MGNLNHGLMSSDRDDWETPRDLFDRCDAIWHFDLDAASSDDNALCESHFTKEDDALNQSWGGVFKDLVQPSLRPRGRQVRREGGKGVAGAQGCRHHHAAARQTRYPVVERLGRALRGGDPVPAWSPEVLPRRHPAAERPVSVSPRAVQRLASQGGEAS